MAIPPTTGNKQPGETATIDENGEEVQLSFWQLPFVQNVLPFITSFVVHAAIIAVGVLSVKYARRLLVTPLHEEQITVAEDISDDAADDAPNPGIGGDPTRVAAQDKMDIPNATGVSDHPADMSHDLTPAGGGAGDNEGDILSSGANENYGAGRGVGMGKGDGSGSGTGEGGGLAPFGVPGGGMGTGKATFLGVRANAKRIVFCCDATGSIMSKFDDLRVEIRKAVNGLRPPQAFSVVFFQDNAPPPLAKELLVATPANKARAFDYVDKFVARGTTDPLPALKAALALKPEVMYFLIDPSDFPDKTAVLELFRKSNPGKTIKLHTIAFIDHDVEDEKFLKQLAAENNGAFKYVSEEDLSKE